MSLTQSGPRWDDTIIAGHRPPGAAVRGRLAIFGRLRPDPREYLPDDPKQRPAVLLALLRADLVLRWGAQERCPIEWYRDRYPELDGESLVALLYEEYCLREEAGESPEAAEYQARFPDVADSFREVLEIHDLIGRARGTGLARARPQRYAVAGGRPDDRRVPAGRGAGPGRIRAGLSRRGAASGRPARRAEGDANRFARAADAGAAPAHPHRPRLLLPDRPGDRSASALHALSRPDHAAPGPQSSGASSPPARAPTSSTCWIASSRPAAPWSERAASRLALARRTYAQAIAWWGARMAEALQHAHDRQVLHRDVKPSNVLVTGDGLPMLLDFNLAQEPRIDDSEAAPAAVGGTLAYMAPSTWRRWPRAGRTTSTPAPISMPWASSCSTAWCGERGRSRCRRNP